MSFRKRNVALNAADSKPSPGNPLQTTNAQIAIPGVRPSPLDGRPTTSTGVQSLDNLVGGYGGLPLGHTVLIEEEGTTDFAGVFLRLFAAEGIVHGQQVHLVGVGEQWGRDLPGLVAVGAEGRGAREAEGKEGGSLHKNDDPAKQDKMKIAWRYERLGEFGTGLTSSRASVTPNRAPSSSSSVHAPSISSTNNEPLPNHPPLQPFCHTFDLTKRLFPLPPALTSSGSSSSPGVLPIRYITLPAPPLLLSSISSTHEPPSITTRIRGSSYYQPVLTHLASVLTSTPPHIHHRLLIPLLLSPALYPPEASNPINLLPFLHSIRALLRAHPTRLTAMISLPLSLYPRSSGLTRWIEHLVDGVVELQPFASAIEIPTENPIKSASEASTAAVSSSSSSSRTGGKATEEKAQGMLRIHKIPVLSERGCGGASSSSASAVNTAGGTGTGTAGTQGGGQEDLVFAVGRKRLSIRPFYLPPVDTEAFGAGATAGEGGVRGTSKDEGSGSGSGSLGKRENMDF